MATNNEHDDAVALAADHGGYTLKNALKLALEARGMRVFDLGTDSAASVDYPDYAHEAARGILRGDYRRAILVCGTGVGMAIAANRHPGIRAVNCSEPYTARLSRSHNDSNVLTLGERVVGPGLALEIVDAWLATRSSDDPRHRRRVDKIDKIDPA